MSLRIRNFSKYIHSSRGVDNRDKQESNVVRGLFGRGQLSRAYLVPENV